MKLSNQVISEQNVQSLGEQIAIIAVKTKSRRLSGKLDRLIKGLLFDVYKRNTPDHIFSDGYDLVQTAVCFLWEYRGAPFRRTLRQRRQREELQYFIRLLPRYRQVFN